MTRSLFLLLALALTGCTSDDPAIQPGPSAAPSVSPTEEPSPVDESEYLRLPETGEEAIESSCQLSSPDGPVYRATLENSGEMQIRKLGDGVLHVSILPSPDADPVSTRVPEDTTWSEADGFLTGESVLWLDDSDNNLTASYRVRWDPSVPAC